MNESTSKLTDTIRSKIENLKLSCDSDKELIFLLEQCTIEFWSLNGKIDVLEQECHWLNLHKG